MSKIVRMLWSVGVVFFVILMMSSPAYGLSKLGALSIGGGVDDVEVNGTWVYLSIEQYLYIVDASEPASPRLHRSFTFDTSSSADNVIDIAYWNNHVFGLTTFGRLIAVDVSNPDSPQQMSSVLYGDGITRYAQQVTVFDGTAYVSIKMTAGLDNVSIINVSSPANQSLVGSIDSMPSVAFPDGNRLYVGSANGDGLEIYNISNPTSPQLMVKSTFGYMSLDVTGITRINSYLLIATSEGLLSVDTSNSYNPVMVSRHATEKLRVTPLDSTFGAATHWGSGIYIFEISSSGGIVTKADQDCDSDDVTYFNGRLYGISSSPSRKFCFCFRQFNSMI